MKIYTILFIIFFICLKSDLCFSDNISNSDQLNSHIDELLSNNGASDGISNYELNRITDSCFNAIMNLHDGNDYDAKNYISSMDRLTKYLFSCKKPKDIYLSCKVLKLLSMSLVNQVLRSDSEWATQDNFKSSKIDFSEIVSQTTSLFPDLRQLFLLYSKTEDEFQTYFKSNNISYESILTGDAIKKMPLKLKSRWYKLSSKRDDSDTNSADAKLFYEALRTHDMISCVKIFLDICSSNNGIPKNRQSLELKLKEYLKSNRVIQLCEGMSFTPEFVYGIFDDMIVNTKDNFKMKAIKELSNFFDENKRFLIKGRDISVARFK